MAIKNIIIKKIKEFQAKQGGAWSDYYIGVTFAPREALFEKHNVNESTDPWFFDIAIKAEIAKEIRDEFITDYKVDGEILPKKFKEAFVYIYKKAGHMVE
ncbi:MAG: hypothetical protein WC860_06625 [Candidatus Margulisiibacteriota bacterium]|jgi:hypothetical protein